MGIKFSGNFGSRIASYPHGQRVAEMEEAVRSPKKSETPMELSQRRGPRPSKGRKERRTDER